MRSPLFPAGRRAGVLAAAVLVSLTTAACGPAAVELDVAGGVGRPHASSPAVTDRPLPRGDAPGSPGTVVPTPSPSPTVPDEPAGPPSPTVPDEPAGQVPVETPVDVPADGSAEPSTGAVDLPDTQDAPDGEDTPERGDVPADTHADTDAGTHTQADADADADAPRAAAAAGTGRGAGSSGGSTDDRAPAAAPAAGHAAAPAGAAPAGAAPAVGAAVEGAAAGSSTGGSGGSFTDQPRRAFSAGNGQTGNYLLYAGGIDPTRPVGLVVYLDGTGEHGVDDPGSSYALGGSSGLVATSRARNAITLAVESPNQSCECWHTGDTTAYADFLAELIEQQLAGYPVSDVWLAGFSSGAQEITRFLVPRHPELMRLGGGWVVFGGGGPPADGGAAVTAARMGGIRGHWYTGTADTAVPLTASWGAQAGERFYAGRGVVTSHEWPAGVGHGLGGLLGQTVGQVIDAS